MQNNFKQKQPITQLNQLKFEDHWYHLNIKAKQISLQMNRVPSIFSQYKKSIKDRKIQILQILAKSPRLLLQNIQQSRIIQSNNKSPQQYEHFNNLLDISSPQKIYKSKSLECCSLLNNFEDKKQKRHTLSLSKKKEKGDRRQETYQKTKAKDIQSIQIKKQQPISKRPIIQKIQDIIERQKNRLKLPSFVRNFKCMQQYQQRTILNNQIPSSKQIQIEKDTISLIHGRKPHLMSKMDQNFYRISDIKQKTYNKILVPLTNTKQKHFLNNFLTEQNKISSFLQQGKLCKSQSQGGYKHCPVTSKIGQKGQTSFQVTKYNLRRKSGKKKLLKLLQNSIKIKCLKDLKPKQQRKLSKVLPSQIRPNIKLNNFQKLPKICYSKTQPDIFALNTDNQYSQNFLISQLKSCQISANKMALQNQKNMHEMKGSSTDIQKLKQRLIKLNETNSQAWQIK